MTFSRHHLAQRATLDAVDLAEVQGCRRAHNQLQAETWVLGHARDAVGARRGERERVARSGPEVKQRFAADATDD